MADKQQLLRVGKISSINYENGTARVTYEDKSGETTPELPFLAWEYWMPKIEDQVLVGHLSNGSSRAVILGPFWYEGHRPHQGREGLYRQEYTNDIGGDGVEYDKKANSLTIKAAGCTITLQGGQATIVAPKGIRAMADVTVAGNLNVSGEETVSGDVVAGGISLDRHTHTGVHGETSGPH